MKTTKTITLLTGLALFMAPAFARSSSRSSSHSGRSSSASRSTSHSSGAVSVRGYTRKNGTHVQPSKRSAPNKTQRDNWSTKGNVNPVTGKAGTKEAVR